MSCKNIYNCKIKIAIIFRKKKKANIYFVYLASETKNKNRIHVNSIHILCKNDCIVSSFLPSARELHLPGSFGLHLKFLSRNSSHFGNWAAKVGYIFILYQNMPRISAKSRIGRISGFVHNIIYKWTFERRMIFWLGGYKQSHINQRPFQI